MPKEVSATAVMKIHQQYNYEITTTRVNPKLTVANIKLKPS